MDSIMSTEMSTSNWQTCSLTWRYSQRLQCQHTYVCARLYVTQKWGIGIRHSAVNGFWRHTACQSTFVLILMIDPWFIWLNECEFRFSNSQKRTHNLLCVSSAILACRSELVQQREGRQETTLDRTLRKQIWNLVHQVSFSAISPSLRLDRSWWSTSIPEGWLLLRRVVRCLMITCPCAVFEEKIPYLAEFQSRWLRIDPTDRRRWVRNLDERSSREGFFLFQRLPRLLVSFLSTL